MVPADPRASVRDALPEGAPASRAFRVGERVLVRWAYEDLELEDEYADGEEDVMVNFAPEADPEGIPLKPSPRLGGFSGYGAA
ncbi:hypothetical protein NUW54_g10604 [Trametes sanguinea]|uniref:Uncharacterized protein n=1 Tax=Trametes sanguinea TaxID=158606 RepID=A0ACC1NX48_9APHY|nr:hypothetical protein NUW54_g10604 [Trametes sanguinea]